MAVVCLRQGGGLPSSMAMNACPSGPYQAGIRCPHHSCREMHQSRIPSSQSKYTFAHRSGTNRIRPSRTAAIAGSARGFIRTNHWVETLGSTRVSQRWQCPTAWR